MFLVEGKLKIELDFQQQMDVVVRSLKEDWKVIQDQANRLIDESLRRPLKDYEREDLNDGIQTQSSIEGVLRYYLPHDEFVEWFYEEDKGEQD